MKFIHMSDCHLGSWNNHPELINKPMEAFETAIDICLDKEVDFVLISGDLFNTNLPDIDTLKQTVEQLKKLRNNNIPVFIIPGSHDFSPSGKTMISVLEKADLLRNVATMPRNNEETELDIIPHNNVEIAGIVGRKGGLEKSVYDNLKNVEKSNKYRIFLFHSAITEYKPEYLRQMKSVNFNRFPQNFDYYAGGHVHKKLLTKKGNKTIAFPGRLFPSNFEELEENDNNGLYLVNVNNENTKIEYKKIKTVESIPIYTNAEDKTTEEVEKEITQKIEDSDIKNKVVCVRVEGILKQGKPSDIDFTKINEFASNALTVKRNTNKLETKEFEEFDVENKNRDELVGKLIKQHLGQFALDVDEEKEKNLVKNLMDNLDTQKLGGETNDQFEKRINEICENMLDLNETEKNKTA